MIGESSVPNRKLQIDASNTLIDLAITLKKSAVSFGLLGSSQQLTRLRQQGYC